MQKKGFVLSSKGFIQLHRTDELFAMMHSPELFAFWVWCLLKASHKDHVQYLGNKQVFLKRGQFVFGRKSAAKALNISERKARTLLDNLIYSKNLAKQSAKTHTILTVVKYDTYQSRNSKSANTIANDRPTTDQEATTNNNGNNDNNGNNNTCDDLPPDNFAGQFGNHQKELLDLWCEGRKSAGLPASRIGGNASGATLLQNAINDGSITIEDARKAVTNIAANKEYGKWSINNVFNKFDMALADDLDFSRPDTTHSIGEQNATLELPDNWDEGINYVSGDEL